MTRTGLMGGTFDPIHVGHLLIAEQARHHWRLDQVVFIPSARPPHKQDEEVTPPEQRYEMALLATATNPAFTCSRLELERSGHSYTVDTLRHFLEAGSDPEHLFFISGADAVLDILTWRRHEEAIGLATFLAAPRPGYDLGAIDRTLPAAYRKRIHALEAPAIAISGTEVRDRVRDGRPIRYLVPEPVEAYIRKHRLYERD